MNYIPLRSNIGGNPQSHSNSKSSRVRTLRLTHQLEELSKSCLEDISAMGDFRKVLLDNRRKMKKASSESNASTVTLPSIADAETLTPAESADRKLTKISISFDAQSANSHLAGFSGAMLNKKEFAVQLRRCLNINLTKDELDELFAKMDVDHSLHVDGVEFVRYFFNLGTHARWKRQMESMERIAKMEDDEKKKVEEENAKYGEMKQREKFE